MCRISAAVILCFLMFLPTRIALSNDAEKLVAQFISNCKQFPQVGVVTINATYPDPHTKLSNITEVRLMPDHICMHFITPTMAGTDTYEQVLIANPYYSGRLRNKESGWFVTELEPVSSEKYAWPNDSPFSFIPNPARILTTNYTIESSTTTTLSGHTYFVVTLKSEAKKPNDNSKAILWFRQDGNVVSNTYAERIEIVEKRGASGTYLFSDFVSIGDCDFPSRLEGCSGIFTTEEWNSNSPPKLGATYTFDYSMIDTKPQSTEFFLSHYGLPEPDYYTPPRPWWLYVSVVGIGMLLFGVLVVRFGRKLRNR